MIFEQVLFSLKKSKLLSIMLIIQLTITFIFCNIAMNNIIKMYNNKNSFNDNYTQKIYYRLVDSLLNHEIEEQFWDSKNSLFRLKQFYNELQIDDNYIYLEMIFQPLAIHSFKGTDIFYENYEKNTNVHENDNIINNKTYNTIKNVMISNSVIKEFNINVCDGRLLNEKDFILTINSETIPIMLGYEYKNLYSIGDILDIFYYNKSMKCKVVGILEENTGVIVDNNNYYDNDLIYLDRMIVTPMVNCNYNPINDHDEYFQRILYFMKTNGTINMKNNLEINYFIDKLNKLREKYDIFEFVIINTSAISIELLSMTIESNFHLMLLASIIMLIFSLISISMIYSCKIINNIIDYGILRLVGCTKTQLYCGIIVESIIITCISTVLAFIVNSIIFSRMITYSFVLFLISLVVITLGCIPPIKQLSNCSIDKMIRR